MKDHLVDVWDQRGFRIKDFDDWMIVDEYYEPIAQQFGPFTVATAVDLLNTNTRCRRSVNQEEDGTKFEYGGHNAYCNPPYSIIILFLLRFLKCKQGTPEGTSALFILPAWTTYEFWKLVVSLPQVFFIEHRFQSGLELFSSPNNPTADRFVVGPTRWPVVAVWVPAHRVNFEINWEEWEQRANLDLCRAGVCSGAKTKAGTTH